MTATLDEPRRDYHRTTTPIVWASFTLSLLIHAAVLWPWVPQVKFPSTATPERDRARGPLVVQLAPPPSRAAVPPPAPPAVRAPEVRPSPAERRPPPQEAPRPPARPAVVALETPAPAVVPPQAPAADAAPSSPPVVGDLSSYIEARRRARAEPATAFPRSSASSAPPVEDETERLNRIVAANLGLSRAPSFGEEINGGGIFRIQRMSHDYAEFVFFGWNKDIQRNSRQLVEVRKGANSDIRLAVIRRMIGIIREREPKEFVWESQRLGRSVTLSARPGDNAGLEDFLMKDLFGDSR